MKIVTVDELKNIRETCRKDGKVVVQCHGCFDIVHPGHVRYLQFSRQQGDLLIVTVSADDVVGKGPDRPYINEQLRLESLAALECVDYVCLDHHDGAVSILDAIRPDVYVKGKEYERKADPRFAKEKELVESYGGKVILSSGEVVYSSTAIIDQFRHRFPLEDERVRFFCQRYEITSSTIDGILKQFAGARVLVLGDPIIDRHIHCDVQGVAAESPIISVTPINEVSYIGAGGLIAKQLCVLGASAGFLTRLGEGEEEDQFIAALAGADVDMLPVREDGNAVCTKVRYVADRKKVFKVDTGRYAPPSTAATEQLVKALEQHLKDYDALIVTDFGYGLFNSQLVQAICDISERLKKPYYVDVSQTRQTNILKFQKARLATPTEEELRFAFGDNESGLSNLASRYYRQTNAEHLILTMDDRGVIYFHPPERPHATRLRTDYLPAFNPIVIDTIGAGDVFLATVALADLTGAGTQTGIYLASCVAGLHVGKLGNEAVDFMDLQTYLGGREEIR